MATGKDYSRSIITASDEVKDIFCEPCEQDGKQIEAEGFCVDCPEYLCGQCYKKHRRRRAFKDHVLQDKDKMPQSVTGAGVKDVCVQKCTKHTNEIIKFFCGSCDSVGCSTCMILDHRKCDKVDDIPKLAISKETQEEIQTFMKKVETMSNQIQDSRHTIKSISNIADDLQQVAMAELEKVHDQINKFFDQLKKEMQQTIDEIHKSNKGILVAASKKYDFIDKELSNIKTDVDKTEKDGQNCEAFINMKHSELDMTRIKTELETLEKESEIKKFEILPSPEIKEMMKRINEICRLETETTATVGSEDISKGNKQLQTVAKPSKIPDKTRKTIKTSEATALKKLRLEKEIDITTSNDKGDPYVRGLTLIHEHYIVVADNENNSVKVVDQRHDKVISEMMFEEPCWSVTAVKGDKVAVGMKSKIQFLSVSKSGSLSKDYAFHTDRTCFDLVYHKDKLIVSQSNGIILITDMQGKIIETFQTDSDGKKLFTSCYGLALNPDDETIYISDHYQNTVTSMSLGGKVKKIYKDNSLKSPWGIAVDNDRYVYVRSTGTGTIHQLSANCDKLQVLENTAGGSITFDKTKTCKLLTGRGKHVRIYQIT